MSDLPYSKPFPLFSDGSVNQALSFAPGDRIFDFVRGVVKTASQYIPQDVKFEYKNGEVSYSDTLPSWWMFSDGASALSRVLSDMDLNRQQIMFCKPDVVEFDIKGLSPDASSRFTIHVTVRNCIGSMDGPVLIKKDEKIFPLMNGGGVTCPKTGNYFPHILAGKETGIRYNDEIVPNQNGYQLFFSGEMGFGLDSTYDVSTLKGSVNLVASSNIFSNLSLAKREVKNEVMRTYLKDKQISEGNVAVISTPVTLKKGDLDGHEVENSSMALIIDNENPLNFPVVFELVHGDDIKYHAGFPQKLMMKNGKVVSASTIRKLLVLTCLLEDELFNDNIHDVAKRNKVVDSNPAVKRVTGGYIIRVNLYDSGDELTDDLPDYSEWLNLDTYVGGFLDSLVLKGKQLGFYYNSIFRGLYGSGTASCYYLTLATLASAVTRMSNKPTNQATMCTTLRYMMCSKRSLYLDKEGPDGLTVKFDYPEGFDKYKMVIPEGDLAYYATSPYKALTSDTMIKGESVGNYMILKTLVGSETSHHFRIVKLNKAGPIGPDSLKIIWDSLGSYHSYDFGMSTADKVFVIGLRTYEVRVSENDDRMVIFYGNTGNFAMT